MYTVGGDSGPWPQSSHFMLQAVPMMGNLGGGYGSPGMDPRSMAGMGMGQPNMQGAYFASMQQPGDSKSSAATGAASSTGFKYVSDVVVMAAGQYREIRPQVAPGLLARGNYVFFVEQEAELPPGLQLDPATGIIWGTPVPPPADSDAAGAYQRYTVVLSGPSGSVSTQLALKVVHFQPQNFKITHVSQLERNKYMVLVDTRGASGSGNGPSAGRKR